MAVLGAEQLGSSIRWEDKLVQLEIKLIKLTLNSHLVYLAHVTFFNISRDLFQCFLPRPSAGSCW